jgi:hypothetical protein
MKGLRGGIPRGSTQEEEAERSARHEESEND